MGALAALGLVSNIVQLIDCGFRVISLAKELHESGEEATYSNMNSGFLAQEMRELSLKLMKQLPASDLSDDEKALSRLTDQCSRLSNKLLVLLDDLKIKKPGSKVDIVMGVLRNMRKKKERDQLEADLNNCGQQLNIQINKMSRSGLTQKLEETLSISSMTQQDILHLKDQVQKLQQNPMVDSVDTADFFKKLQKVIETPLQHFCLLQDLRDPRMLDRFENVDTAHGKTFEWLIHGPDNSRNDAEAEDYTSGDFEAKSQKHREFVSWLQDDIVQPSGSSTVSSRLRAAHKQSIFYIAGKPGAGKSTLMKFICQNKVTLERLESWSGEKKLICAKAFFWRLGNDEQKNLTGLAKCLLYQIFIAAPALIPTVSSLHAQTYFTTLRRLLTNGQTFEKHKIMLFIDGLDEYEGRPLELIREILGWTMGSYNDLKICVASRQWNEFEVGFEGCPSLRIHEWTHHDIRNFAMDRFEEIGDLAVLIDTRELKTLAEVIVTRAEGVFLWVRVVLASIEQGVLNGDDFKDLQKKVSAFPTELKDLYQYLFDSIPEYDRQMAFETLILTSHYSTSLLQYKFLGDLSKDPDFAIKMPLVPLSEETLRRYLAHTRRQINGRCKCFLEIRAVYPDTTECYQGEEIVSYMHSTVEEFLTQKHIRDAMEPYVGHIDTFDRLCQTFIALAKSIHMLHLYSSKDLETSKKLGKQSNFTAVLEAIIVRFTAQMYDRPSLFHVPRLIDRFLDFLNHINLIVVQKFEEHGLIPGYEIVHHNFIYFSNSGRGSWIERSTLFLLPGQFVKTLAAQRLLFEYFEQGRYCDLRAIRQADPLSMDIIVKAIFSGVSRGLYTRRAIRMLEVLFQAGISPNVQIDIIKAGVRTKLELWDNIMRRIFLKATSVEKAGYEEGLEYQLIEVGLRHGAMANFDLVFGPCYEMTNTNQLIIKVNVCGVSG
ncbi:hypothetical protein F5B19DRAFT_473206 [Rostrohypoxylon terebratum]|nr:hypothetical protein F5B19DRAFT_473206 [Rostrohypoxylon terebratum]